MVAVSLKKIFFKQKTAYEITTRLVGSEMCIRDSGEIICRCEKVTKAELLQAIHNPLGVHTMTGIKYRTRAMMGRCQGGYCQMRLEQMLEEELGVRETEVLYARQGSQVLMGRVREEV